MLCVFSVSLIIGLSVILRLFSWLARLFLLRFLLFSHKTTSYFDVHCYPLLFLFGDGAAASLNRNAQQ